MLTSNEKNILRFLMSSFKDHSINQVAKKCHLTPNGAYKIFKKFEKEGILKPTNIANIKSYKLNFKNKKTYLILELALISELKRKIKYRLEDLKELQKITKCCIIFGSYIKKKKPNDIDILFILNRKHYKEYSKKLQFIKNIMPIKVHDVVQTKKDLENNIKEKDQVIFNILRTGIILWGQRTLIEVVANVYKK